jgi:hypothetical protein
MGCPRCDDTGIAIAKHGESSHHSSGSKIKCSECCNTPEPFKKWQKDQCSTCPVSKRVVLCSQIRNNYVAYANGRLSLKEGCPEREKS